MYSFRFALLLVLTIGFLTGCLSSNESGNKTVQASKADGSVPGCDSNGSTEDKNPNCVVPNLSPVPTVSPEPTSTPVTPTTYSQISSRNEQSCGITTSGDLKCWGFNGAGGLGDGTVIGKLTPITIDNGTKYSQISTGSGHTCGVTMDGVLKCWGLNGNGQLGDGTTQDRLSPVIIDAGVTYSKVEAGQQGTCAITSLGQLKCWGLNHYEFGSYGQLGDGTSIDRLLPTVIDEGVTYTSISGSFLTRCGITTTGVLKCWGRNHSTGAVGDGTFINRSTPTIVDPGTTYKYISTAIGHSCGITTSGILKCWGATVNLSSPSPTVIDPGTSYSAVAAGHWATCMITATGVLKCWGANTYGHVGNNGNSWDIVALPMIIDSGVTYLNVTGSSFFSCGITNENLVKCWGRNYFGQLGDGTTTDRYLPTPLSQ